MRKINKKILVAALSLLLVACAFVTILSFTMAADGDGEDSTNTVSANPDIDIVTIYNIDRIIQNSINGSDKDFHIVEISSSTNYSAMNNGNIGTVFAEYVFNGYKTIDEKMKPENIDYKPFSTTELNSDSSIQTCVNAITKADLIYVHNDSSNYFGKSGNDIPEMIKLQLCSAAVGDFVPFIIDGPIATQEIIVSNSSTYQDLVNKVFKKYGGIKYTYSWDTNPGTSSSPNPNYQGDAKAYFKHQSSLYVQIDGKTQKSKWTKVYGIEDYDVNSNLPPVDPTATGSDAESETNKIDRTKPYVKVAKDPATIGRILVINKTAADGAISKLVKAGITEYNGTCILEEDAKAATTVKDKDDNDVKLIEKVTGDDGQLVTPHNYNSGNVKLYSVPDTSGLYNAYISRNAHPNYMSFEYYASNDAALNNIDYSLYDLVIIEKDVSLNDEGIISNDNYDHLVAAMNGNQHILYDKSLASGSTGGSTTVVNYGDNYDYVCGKVMTTTESGKYDNILVTNATRMKAYMSANNKEAVKDIADIINKASYRGIGGGDGDSSNVYTVLEIQPAYPIDTVLSQKFANIDNSNTNIKKKNDPLEKNSYKSNMTFADVSGRNKDLTVESNYAGTSNNSWYYLRNQGVLNNTTSDEISFDGTTSLTSFLESNAYITSDMLSQVTDYYAWTISKAKVAHATGLPYDQVNVIHMSTYEFNCTKKTLIDNFDAIYIGGNNSAIKQYAAFGHNVDWNVNLSSLGISTYTMYFKDGDSYMYKESYGSDQGNVGTFIGNDISQNKYKELLDYKNANMPIIIGKDAAAGLSAANAIDPNTLMYSFLKTCQSESAKDNILWNFDYDDKVKIANAGGEYGNTYEGYVTVFGGVATEDYQGNTITIDTTRINEEDLKETLKNSSQRPKLVVKSAPVQYKEGDKSTWITDHNLVWTYEAAGGDGFTARLIFDDNSNSRFDDDPVVDTDSGKSGTVGKKMDPDFFGVIYWKLEVENSAGLKSSTTGCIKIARTNQEKIKINVLQIMPDEAIPGGDNAENSLFLCTECQQARHILYGNVSPTTAGTKYTPHIYNSIAGDRRGDGLADGNKTTHGGYDESILSGTTTVENQIKNLITNATTDGSPSYIDFLPKYGDSGILSDGRLNEFEYRVVNNIGVHEHRFGIVKYDSQKEYGQDNIAKGVDDWNTNWFTDVRYDYDVNLDILYLDEYEDLVEYTENIYSGEDTSNIKTIRNKNEQSAADFENAYKAMVKVINGTYKNSADKGGLTDAEKGALQKFMFRKEGFGLGQTLTDAQKTSIEAEADEAANKVAEDAADAAKLAAGSPERLAYISSYWTDVSTETRAQYVARYIELKQNEIIYGNFETILDKYAKAGPNLDNYLEGIKGSAFGSVDAATALEEIEYELSSESYDDRPYHDIFSLFNTTNSSNAQTYAGYYAVWRDAKLYEQYFEKMYKYFSFISAVDDSGKMDLTKHYNCMLFGAARNFGGADIESDAAIDSIITFISNGGQAMLFYDTLTSSSTVNMTNRLGPYFGVNAYSEPVDTTGSGGTDDSTSVETYEGTIKIDITDPWNSTPLYTYTVDTAATEVNLEMSCGEGENGNLSRNFALIDSSDDKTSNEGNYGKHDIAINITIHCANAYYCSGGKVYINGSYYKDIPGAGNGADNYTSKVIVNTSVVKEPISGGNSGNNGGNNSAPAAHNPSKLTYRTALQAETPGTSKSHQFNYLMYSASNATVESKTHPAKDLFDAALNNKVETNAADMNNEGIVTMYPFSIGSNLRISPTEESDFTINVADDNLIVYYSFSGGTSGTISSPYVADPHDGSNNYFVYQYQPDGTTGMVTYLGAGCTMITGTTKENNDERRFFINLILNTGRKSTRTTTLSLYDHKSVQVVSDDGVIGSSSLSNGVVQEDGNMYKMVIADGTLPEFSMMLTSDSSIEIAAVYAYYDLDYDKNTDDEYHADDDKHVMVYKKEYNKSKPYNKTTNPWIASGYLMWVDKDTSLKSSSATVFVDGKEESQSMLKIEDKYLYNDEYTYIVVKIVDTKGVPHYKRLKIIIKPALHDLT